MLAQGQLFAGYRIERLLGAGGMGEVYLAHDRDLPRMIALKVLGRGVSDDENVRSRFLREADTVARLAHPNIVAVYARGEEHGQLWMAMQYIDGTDLAHVLQSGPLAPQRAVHIITEVAKALDHAHATSVLHRDVKPANILLTHGASEQVFLADFGIAKVLDQVSEATRTGQLYASLRYAAPEQFDAGAPVDARTDVYALGGTLLHLLTGAPPYPGDTAGQLLHGHLNLPVPQPTLLRPALPAGFDAVIAGALAKHPEHRFGSCGELAAAARQALAGLPVHAPAATGQGPAADRTMAGVAASSPAAAGSPGTAATVATLGADAPTEQFGSTSPPARQEHPSGSGTGLRPRPGGPADAGAKRRPGFLGWTALVLGWLLLLTGATGIVLHYVSWSNYWIGLVAAFASYFMVGAFVALVLFLIGRQWRSAATALVASGVVLWSQLPMLWPDGTAPPGVDVTVMQSNLLFGGADVATVAHTVRDDKVDVLTLEELTQQALDGLLAAGITSELPYYHVEPAAGGQGSGIFSRYPLQDGVKIDGFLLHNLRATMIHPQLGPVTVFQFHPVPPLGNPGTWQRELQRVRDVLDQQPGKVVVGGDFNATFDHADYRNLLRGRYADAGELVGIGALPTWPEDKPGGPYIGIDKVLVAGGHATEVRSLTIPGSDHRAVVARLRL
ncbi:protein kinase domain-containing protein [Nocardia huaxiensis]|nr:protein kinase [Nocardia huaxiensis]UFS99636.1 protein kinase [Nocardia huaxiensis]